MILRTALGKEIECHAITQIPTSRPPCIYLHLPNTGFVLAWSIVGNPSELPLAGNEGYSEVYKKVAEGANGSKVVLNKQQ